MQSRLPVRAPHGAGETRMRTLPRPPSMRRRILVAGGASLCLVAGWAIFAPVAFAPVPAWQTVLAMLLYLGAHALRAVRLAIIAGAILGVAARTAALLHLAAAPLVMLVPFKLGEFVRLHQLWVVGRRLPGAVVVLLIDRAMDAVMLLATLAWMGTSLPGMGAGTPLVFALALVAMGLLLATFLIGPEALAGLQRYIVLNHRHPAPLAALPLIDGLRRNVGAGGLLLRRHGALLLALSLMIWALELAGAAIFAAAVIDPVLGNPAGLLFARATREWHLLLGSGGEVAVTASASAALLSLLLVWPAALWFYLGRLEAGPVRRAGEVAHVP